jgi:sporulation protein YqfC
MRRPKGNLQAMAAFLEIPPDIVLDLPRLTMLGNKQLLVENHKGIIEYTPVLVRVKLSQGELAVTGDGLSIGNLQLEHILVEGTIRSLEYEA